MAGTFFFATGSLYHWFLFSSINTSEMDLSASSSSLGGLHVASSSASPEFASSATTLAFAAASSTRQRFSQQQTKLRRRQRMPSQRHRQLCLDSSRASSSNQRSVQRTAPIPLRRSTPMAFRRAQSLLKALESSRSHGNLRGFNSLVGSHTAKWMQDTSKKSPMELINEVPPIKVEGRIVACEGDSNPALGHPIEFICLDLKDPAICKYCGLRYVQHDHHH